MFTRLTDEKHQLDEKGCLRLLKMLVPFVSAANYSFAVEYKDLLDQFGGLIYNNKYKKLTALDKLKIKHNLRESAKEISETIYNLLGDKTCREIKYLVDSEVLVLQKFEHMLDDVEGCVTEFFHLLQNSIKSSFPLFDDKSNDLMSAAIELGIINLSTTDKRKATHAGISDSYIQMLPSFEMASVEELIDIKNELSKPLVRFRSKMLTFSDQIMTSPWDEDFQEDCMLLYHKEVLPAIQELNELASDNSIIKNLLRSTITDKEILKSTAGLVISVAAVGVLSAFTDAISANPTVIAAGSALAVSKIANVYSQYGEQKKELLRNDLYFYYKAGKLLS